ncbi:ABC transporter ATP-binding protein [Arthrobacter gyeryongensis]|uniref:ABC transporter ATP-binding protein n=1 Tax=Arthrobacter gyeryongensis TaxID=1650592 RepID=A0ABP8VA65_9MICC
MNRKNNLLPHNTGEHAMNGTSARVIGDTKITLTGAAQAYSVRGGRREVLTGIDIEIKTNESVAVIGPTGVGKSTLLRLIAGFEDPTSGEVKLWNDGRSSVAAPAADIGYLFQQPALFPWMTVKQNVLFGARHGKTYGHDKQEMLSQADYFMERVGLLDAADLFPYQISGGMRARTALARVFLTRPKVLLMDEPFGALDALTRREMYVLLRDLVSKSPELTTVMVTHDVDEAITLCGTIMIISGIPGTITSVYRSGLAAMAESAEDLQREPDYVELKAALLKSLNARRNETRTTSGTAS